MCIYYINLSLLTGEGLENFWKVLVDGKNCSVPIPRERFDLAGWYDPDDTKAGKSCTANAALIEGYVLIFEHIKPNYVVFIMGK